MSLIPTQTPTNKTINAVHKLQIISSKCPAFLTKKLLLVSWCNKDIQIDCKTYCHLGKQDEAERDALGKLSKPD